MHRLFQGFLAVAAALTLLFGLDSCQTQTPASRIAANPVMFRSLPAEQQLLVQQGQICTGMGPDAVYLAWGYPSGDPVRGQSNGKSFERWVYMRTRAVPTAGMGVGFRHGPYGAFWDDCYEPFVYIPEEVARVRFEDGKVTQWEKRGVTPGVE